MHIPLLLQLAILALGVIFLGGLLKFLLRMAWRIIGLAFTAVILIGGALLVLQFLHK